MLVDKGFVNVDKHGRGDNFSDEEIIWYDDNYEHDEFIDAADTDDDDYS